MPSQARPRDLSRDQHVIRHTTYYTVAHALVDSSTPCYV